MGKQRASTFSRAATSWTVPDHEWLKLRRNIQLIQYFPSFWSPALLVQDSAKSPLMRPLFLHQFSAANEVVWAVFVETGPTNLRTRVRGGAGQVGVSRCQVVIKESEGWASWGHWQLHLTWDTYYVQFGNIDHLKYYNEIKKFLLWLWTTYSNSNTFCPPWKICIASRMFLAFAPSV